eukprot:COSAG06_NODE_6407_length_2945_cov_76.420942_2_plen_66_part_00
MKVSWLPAALAYKLIRTVPVLKAKTWRADPESGERDMKHEDACHMMHGDSACQLFSIGIGEKPRQ